MIAMRTVLACVALVATVTAMMASCSRESLHTANLLIDGEDGGALNGFDCIDSDEPSHVVSCIVAGCSESCRSDRLAFADCVKTCTTDEDGGIRKKCSAQTGSPLMARAGGKQVCVVLDYLRIGGEVECRSPFALFQWCREPDHATCPILDRHAISVHLPDVPADAGAAELKGAVNAMYAAIRDAVTKQPVLSSPSPDEWVVARLFASTQDCATLTADPKAIDLPQVVGCAFSCTVLLRDRTDIPLELDNGFQACQTPLVHACAAFGTTALATVSAEFNQPSP
jgi:hypothetical protein